MLTGRHMLEHCSGRQCFLKSGPFPRKMPLLGGLSPTCLCCCSLHVGANWDLGTFQPAAGLSATTLHTSNYSLHPIRASAEVSNACSNPSPSAFSPTSRVSPGLKAKGGGHRGCSGVTHTSHRCFNETVTEASPQFVSDLFNSCFSTAWWQFPSAAASVHAKPQDCFVLSGTLCNWSTWMSDP